ncbi:MAG: alpha/beta hydrolase [Parvibaculum sp.]
MPKHHFSGPFSMRLASFLALGGIGISTYARHIFGWRMEPTWGADFEVGIRFWRRQFTKAMRQSDISRGRWILDSLQTETNDRYEISVEASVHPAGHWYVPKRRLSGATLLYLHGGGYTFHGAMSKRFAAMLAHRCGARLFAPDYRLTPEHPHPAQAEDALAAWRFVTDAVPPESLVVVGDSAGGHMALTLMQSLRAEGLPQPALCIGLCPWTDIGDRGPSLHGNDRYDLVQGWMALRFGEWLDPEGRYGRTALSPVFHDYKGLAPIYLQAGGREILCDMIRDFAEAQVKHGADVLLDIWPDMPHEFQAFDTWTKSSTESLSRIRRAIGAHVDGDGTFGPGPNTFLSHGTLSGR